MNFPVECITSFDLYFPEQIDKIKLTMTMKHIYKYTDTIKHLYFNACKNFNIPSDINFKHVTTLTIKNSNNDFSKIKFDKVFPNLEYQ